MHDMVRHDVLGVSFMNAYVHNTTVQ